MIKLDQYQTAEVQQLTGLATDDSTALVAALKSKASADLAQGNTTAAQHLLEYYRTNFAKNFAGDLKRVFTDQSNAIKYDTTLTEHEKAARIEKLRTAYTDDAFKVAETFKQERDSLIASIREAARKKALEAPAIEEVDPLLEGEFQRDLKAMRNKMLITLDAKRNVEAMNDLIAKYKEQPALVAQLNDTFADYAQATTAKSNARDVALALSQQLQTIEAHSVNAEQHQARELAKALDGAEQQAVFHPTYLERIGSTINERYARQLNDVEKGRMLLETDKQAYVEKEQAQTSVKAFEYTYTAPHDAVVE